MTESCWINVFGQTNLSWTLCEVNQLHWWFLRTHFIRVSHTRRNTGVTIVDRHKVPSTPPSLRLISKTDHFSFLRIFWANVHKLCSKYISTHYFSDSSPILQPTILFVLHLGLIILPQCKYTSCEKCTIGCCLRASNNNTTQGNVVSSLLSTLYRLYSWKWI